MIPCAQEIAEDSDEVESLVMRTKQVLRSGASTSMYIVVSAVMGTVVDAVIADLGGVIVPSLGIDTACANPLNERRETIATEMASPLMCFMMIIFYGLVYRPAAREQRDLHEGQIHADLANTESMDTSGLRFAFAIVISPDTVIVVVDHALEFQPSRIRLSRCFGDTGARFGHGTGVGNRQNASNTRDRPRRREDDGGRGTEHLRDMLEMTDTGGCDHCYRSLTDTCLMCLGEVDPANSLAFHTMQYSAVAR